MNWETVVVDIEEVDSFLKLETEVTDIPGLATRGVEVEKLPMCTVAVLTFGLSSEWKQGIV